MKIFCLLMTVVLQVWPTTGVNAQDRLTVDKEHMIGVMESHFLDLESWRKLDVLIRVTTTGEGRHWKLEDQAWDKLPRYIEGPDASLMVLQEKALFRVAFDLDAQQAIVVGRWEDEQQVFDALDNETPAKKRAGDHSLLMNSTPGVVFAKSGSNSAYRRKDITTVSQLLDQSGVVDIRGLGWMGYAPWNSTLFRRQTDYLLKSGAISEISHMGQDRYKVTFLNQGKYKGQYQSVDWNLKKALPVKYASGTDSMLGQEVLIQWASIEGNDVPKHYRFMNYRQEIFGGRQYFVKREGTIELHWFSFDQMLSDDLFNEEILNDRKRLDALMDETVFAEKSDDTEK